MQCQIHTIVSTELFNIYTALSVTNRAIETVSLAIGFNTMEGPYTTFIESYASKEVVWYHDFWTQVFVGFIDSAGHC